MQSNHFELGLGRGALREDVDGGVIVKRRRPRSNSQSNILFILPCSC